MLIGKILLILTSMIPLCGILNPDEKCRVFRHFSNCFSSLGDIEFLCETAKPENQAFGCEQLETLLTLTSMSQLRCDLNPDEKCHVFRHFSV